jgi:hypothetical protein
LESSPNDLLSNDLTPTDLSSNDLSSNDPSTDDLSSNDLSSEKRPSGELSLKGRALSRAPNVQVQPNRKVSMRPGPAGAIASTLKSPQTSVAEMSSDSLSAVGLWFGIWSRFYETISVETD